MNSLKKQIIENMKSKECYAQPNGILHFPWVAKDADTRLLYQTGELLRVKYGKVDRVVSPAIYGAIPGAAFSAALGRRLIVARKEEMPPTTWSEYITTENPVPSATIPYQLSYFKIPIESVHPKMDVLLVDDFIRHGTTEIEIAKALLRHRVDINGIVNVIEKEYDGGRRRIKRELGIGVEAVVKIERMREIPGRRKVRLYLSELLFEPASLRVDLSLRPWKHQIGQPQYQRKKYQ